MAKSYTYMLALPLLVLAISQGCSGDPDHRQDFIIAVMQAVTQSLDCFQDTTQEELRLQRENAAALSNLHPLLSLPDKVLQLEELITQQNGNINSVKKDVAALLRVEALSQEINILKEQLGNKDHTVDLLTQEIEGLKSKLEDKEKLERLQAEMLTECRQQVSSLSDSEKRLNSSVQDLKGRLLESKQVQQLENSLQQLNSTVETQTRTTSWDQECTQPNLHEIKKPVQEFISNKNWQQLRSDLVPLLSPNGTVYSHVMDIDDSPMYRIGYRNYRDLVSLLMCAGLSVDTPDDDGFNMLFGAALGNKLQLVQMLLDNGADVTVRDKYDETPLIKTAQYDQPEMVKMLLAHGAGVNKTTIDGWTSLMSAAHSDRLEVAKILVQAGADLKARNRQGLTALGVARKYGSRKTEAYLKQLPH